MGYYIGYQPISEKQIETWCFDLRQNTEKLKEISAFHRLV